MQRFVLEQSSQEVHTSHAGLALLGRAIRLSGLEAAVDELPLLHGIAHRDIVKSYLGLLALGKSDFEAVGNMRDDPFFRQALDIERVPSTARLRLRLESHAEALMERVDVALVEFLKTAQGDFEESLSQVMAECALLSLSDRAPMSTSVAPGNKPCLDASHIEDLKAWPLPSCWARNAGPFRQPWL